jgi:hypothetical protein
MKVRGLADQCEASFVFSSETPVAHWKLLARGGAEAYDGGNVSPSIEE